MKQERDKTLNDVEAKLRQVNEYPSGAGDRKVGYAAGYCADNPNYADDRVIN